MNFRKRTRELGLQHRRIEKQREQEPTRLGRVRPDVCRVGAPGQELLEQDASVRNGPGPEAAVQVADGAGEGGQPEAGADNSVDEVQGIGDRAVLFEGVAPLFSQLCRTSAIMGHLKG